MKSLSIYKNLSDIHLEKNSSVVFWYTVLHNLSISSSFTPATISKICLQVTNITAFNRLETCNLSAESSYDTYAIFAGSFLPFTMLPACHFSFLTVGNVVLINLAPACVGRTSHQGQSVSSIRRSFGIFATTSRLLAVLSELLENIIRVGLLTIALL